MIVEELIYFDQDKLRCVRSIEDQLNLTKNFFTTFSPVTKNKLDFMIKLLKERELEDRPYTYPNTNFLLGFWSIIVICALIFSLIGNSPIVQIRKELLWLTGSLIIAWMGLRIHISKKLKQRKYARLIRVLEIYHKEL